MTETVVLQAAIVILNLAAVAGIAWANLKQTKREVGEHRAQLNGVGGKVREQQRESDRRYFVVSVSVLLVTPVEKQKDLAEMLLKGWPE